LQMNGDPVENRTAERPNVACVERPAAARKKALASRMGKVRLSTEDVVIQNRRPFQS
jgi:hypothetical protein